MKKIFVLGDSISIYYGPFLEKLLKGKMDYDRKGKDGEVGNINSVSPMNGGDSNNVLEYVRDYLKKEYDVMLLNCGLHDIKTVETKQVPEDKYKSNLEEVISLVRGKGKEIIWVNTTPVNDEVHLAKLKDFKRFNKDVIKYNEIAKEVMDRLNVPVIDLYTFTAGFGKDIYADHVHFLDEICEKQAEFIKEAILSLV